MASYFVARQSASEAKQTLFYVQAIDQPLGPLPQTKQSDLYENLMQVQNVSTNNKIPAVFNFHQGMRMRLTPTIQQPFCVQDTECSVVGFDPDPHDRPIQEGLDCWFQTAEQLCGRMPKAIYVKLDGCEHQFLRPRRSTAMIPARITPPFYSPVLLLSLIHI